MNTKKLNSVYLLVVLLTGALVLAPALTGFASNVDEADEYINNSEVNAWVTLLQFDVKNTDQYDSKTFGEVTVSYDGTSAEDLVDLGSDSQVAIATADDFSNGNKIDSADFASGQATLDGFSENISADTTQTYYIAVKMDTSSDVTEGNEVGATLESVGGQDPIEATATLPFSSSLSTIDVSAPELDYAITGDLAGGNSTEADHVYLDFKDDVSGLDVDTVTTADFDQVNTTNVSSINEKGADYVILTLASPLTTGAEPSIETLSDSISDNAGNTLDLSGGEWVSAANDGLKPEVSSVENYTNNGYGKEDTIDVVFTEDLGLRGNVGVYSVDYGGRTITPTGVSLSGGTVTVSIPDQSLKSDPADASEFNVTVNTPANVKDTNQNSVDPNIASGSHNVNTFITDTEGIYSAETTSTSTIEVQFNVNLDGGTVAPGDFTVANPDDGDFTPDTAEEISPGLVELTLKNGHTFGTGDTPQVTYAEGSLTDVAGDSVSDTNTGALTGDGEYTDGVAPVLDSAEATSTTTVDVIYSEGLSTGTAAAADFAVTAGGSAVTVDEAAVSSDTVTLTLASEIAYDATPSVDYTAGTLADDSSNENLAADASATAADKINPVLESVSWTKDTEVTGEVDEMDVLTFTFSEPMDTSSFDLDSKSVGSGKDVSWSNNDTVAAVTLASGTDISAGDELAPSTDMADASDNANSAVADSVVLSYGVKTVTLWDGETEDTPMPDPQYSSIQNAIDNAESGDYITVGAAYDASVETETDIDDTTYLSEDVGDALIEVDKPVVIEAAEGADPVIDGTVMDDTADKSDVTIAITATTDKVVIEGLTVKNSIYQLDLDDDATTPVSVTDPKVDLIENTVEGPFDPDNGKAVFVQGDDSVIDGNVVKASPEIAGENVASSGILAYGTKDGYVLNNEVFGSEIGITISASWDDTDSGVTESIEVTGNDVHDNGQGMSIQWEVDDTSVEENEVYQNSGPGVMINARSDKGPQNTTLKNNNIENNEGSGVGLAAFGSGSKSDIGTVTATSNYWGAKDGPSAQADTTESDYTGTSGVSYKPAGSGDVVEPGITYRAWLNAAYPDGRSVGTISGKDLGFAAEWNLMSVNFKPVDPSPAAVFNAGSPDLLGQVFRWFPADQAYGTASALEDVKGTKGYWVYTNSGDSGRSMGDGTLVKSDVTLELPNAGWHMISAPFAASMGQVTVNYDGTDYTMNEATGDADPIVDSVIWDYAEAGSDSATDAGYVSLDSTGAALSGSEGYWFKTFKDGVTLTIPYKPGTTPSSSSLSAMNASAVIPASELPADVEKPPAPPAAKQGATELQATAATSADGVTFKVEGADVSSINVQVFSAEGTEIFSGSAAGSTLSWNADVANGVYLYGVSAEVDGEVTPLGIQKLLILE